MKRRFLLVVLVAGCTASRLTQYRSGWRSCRAADPNLIECGGKQMAQVECFHPGEEACGALAIRYADGERVFLLRPPGFEPTPDSEAALDDRAVLRPELASDASKIWYRAAGSGRDVWTIFEPETGITRQVDSFQIFQIREKDPHSMPLWVAVLPK
jgi:hypothetical protein